MRKWASRLDLAEPSTYSRRVVKLSTSVTLPIGRVADVIEANREFDDVARLGLVGRSDLDDPQARIGRDFDAERGLCPLIAGFDHGLFSVRE